MQFRVLGMCPQIECTVKIGSSVLCCRRDIRGRTTGLHMTEELNAVS